MLQQLGCQIIDLGVIRDDQHALRAAFQQADTAADLVISSGGVSVGEADYTKQILDELGDIGFWKLAIKPGKPFAFGKLSNAWFCGLPGNPVSAALTFYQLVQPLLAKLSGHTEWHPPLRLKAKATTPLKKNTRPLGLSTWGFFQQCGRSVRGSHDWPPRLPHFQFIQSRQLFYRA